MAKITAVSMKYKCQNGTIHSVLAMVIGSPSTPNACVKALEKCDNKMATNRLLKHPVKEIIECETVSQAI